MLLQFINRDCMSYEELDVRFLKTFFLKPLRIKFKTNLTPTKMNKKKKKSIRQQEIDNALLA